MNAAEPGAKSAAKNSTRALKDANAAILRWCLRQHMDRAGYTAQGLSTAIGMEASAVKQILAGRSRGGRKDTLEKLAAKLAVPVAMITGDYLFAAMTDSEQETAARLEIGARLMAAERLRNETAHAKDPDPAAVAAYAQAEAAVVKTLNTLTPPGAAIEAIAANLSDPLAGPGQGLPGTGGGAADLPVYASAQGGARGALILDMEPIEYVPRPAPLAHVRGGFAFYVIDDSMEPLYEQGDVVFVHPHKPPQAGNNVVVLSVAADNTMKAMVKRLVKFDDSGWKLRQYNPAKDFTLKRRDWPHCYRVVGKYDRA